MNKIKEMINNLKQIDDTKSHFVSILTILIILMVLNAWVTEDAFITFRVIDNFINGFGLRWNIDERVQVFTHPLWLIILTPFYYLTSNIFLTSITISIILSISAVWLIIIGKQNKKETFAFIAMLALSKAFVEFTTSGLENCLSYFLFALFLFTLKNEKIFWFRLSLIASLAAVNRLDTVVIYAPVFIYLIFEHRKSCNWLGLIFGGLPLVLWEIFSLFYYGFLFPNTKYAKLNTGIATIEYIQQGGAYIIDLLLRDPVSFLIILSSFVFLGLSIIRTKNTPRILLPIAAGNAIYITYIIIIGGDFMSGRFFSLPVFISAYIIYEAALSSGFYERKKRRNDVFYLLLFLFYLRTFNLLVPHLLITTDGIADEKEFYSHNRLINMVESNIRTSVISSPYRINGLDMLASENTFFEWRNIGMNGYYAGATKIIIDTLALSDPLLSRLPMDLNNILQFTGRKGWRIGRFYRKFPTGFLYARKTGDTSQMSSNMAAYYGKIREITTGDLWSINRFKTIVEFNLGKYDHLIRK